MNYRIEDIITTKCIKKKKLYLQYTCFFFFFVNLPLGDNIEKMKREEKKNTTNTVLLFKKGGIYKQNITGVNN